jgi:ferritin-like protein
MKALGMVLGVVGLPLLIVPPLGLFVIVLGAMFIIVGQRREQRQKVAEQAAIEERRHQEMLAAARGQNFAPNSPKKDDLSDIFS